MTKRIIRDTGGFFPEYEDPDNGRYKVRGKDRKWTTAEDAVLVAAVSACRGRPAYLGMAPCLMAALRHLPAIPNGSIPSPAKHADTCKRALENRLVYKMLGGHNWKPGTFAGFHKPRHEDYPLTWGVKVKILRPYHTRKLEGKPIIPLEQLMRMIGRTCDKPIRDYFNRIDASDFEDQGDDTAESPIKDFTVEKLADAVQSLDYCLEVDSPSWKYKDAIARLLRT